MLRHVPCPVLPSATSDPAPSSDCRAWQYPVAKSRIVAPQMPLPEASGPHWIKSPPDVVLRKLPGLYGFLEKTLIYHSNNDLCSQFNLLSIFYMFLMCTPSAYPLGMNCSLWRSKFLPLKWVCAVKDFRTPLCFIWSSGWTLITVEVFLKDVIGIKANIH